MENVLGFDLDLGDVGLKNGFIGFQLGDLG